MCQTLGWHHATTPESASSPDRLRPGAFWFCYMIDKGLALRFGRTCMLPDWDISTPREFFHGKSGSRDKINDNRPVNNPENQDPGALHNIFNVWIRTGAVLGQTYEHLYSPAALARSPQERTDTATRLGTATKQIWSDFEKLSSTALHGEIPRGHADPGHANVDDWRQATLKRVLLSGEVGHLATLTLIYRAIPHAKPPSKEAPSSSSLSTELPNSSLHAECVSAARGAFRSHLECMALASDDPLAQVGHLHWTVLYSPFTPLIVLFCHVIETASRLRRAKASLVEEEITTDLAHLEAFAASLQPLISLSPAIARMHGLSRLLHQLAALYVQAKRAENDRQVTAASDAGETSVERIGDMQIDSVGWQGVGSDLDLYLSQLGFLPDPNSAIRLEATGPHSVTEIQNANTGGVDAVLDPSCNPVQPRLEEWFSGNTYVMGLVEDELFDFGWDSSMVENSGCL